MAYIGIYWHMSSPKQFKIGRSLLMVSYIEFELSLEDVLLIYEDNRGSRGK